MNVCTLKEHCVNPKFGRCGSGVTSDDNATGQVTNLVVSDKAKNLYLSTHVNILVNLAKVLVSQSRGECHLVTIYSSNRTNVLVLVFFLTTYTSSFWLSQ